MAELSPRERLQPSLLDRLTDRAPGERDESREARVLSMKQIKESVIRDLQWLLNTTNLAMDLSEYPEVERSVVNYGLPPLEGWSASGTDTDRLKDAIRTAIRAFEPRILKNSLRVSAEIREGKMDRTTLSLVLEGDLWGQPMPLHLYLRTRVDLETGDVSVNEGESPRR